MIMVVLVVMLVNMLSVGASAATYTFKGKVQTVAVVTLNDNTTGYISQALQGMGMNNASYVKACQAVLKDCTSFYSGSVDGQFGSATHTGVYNYQYAHGLSKDGIVGFNTWGELYYETYGFIVSQYTVFPGLSSL